MKIIFAFLLLAQSAFSLVVAQNNQPNAASANRWADSVLKSLSQEQRIAQLMVLRLSSYDFKTKTPIYYDSLVSEMVKQYNIGGICLFQGNPVKLATIINSLQRAAQTPIMACIDAEWGVGMRLIDSVQALPHQMMLGAMQDSHIIYQYGKLVAAQCKRLGLHVNYAPVVDVNNNPNNPVINDRSFGEDKYKVAAYGIQYMKGMQDAGVMACAKHFPGHGDVSVDSHLDLPVINKSMAALDSLELYPFRRIFAAGISSVMVAHLYIPAIDSTANRATSISPKNINGLMRNQLGYQGLTFTDALEMQGVQKFFPDGAASVQSLIAGNDMLCLPGDVAMTINKIKEAIKKGQLTWNDIDQHCKKVLLAKYQYVLGNSFAINSTNITRDLNDGIADMKRLVAENALTILSKADNSFSNTINVKDAEEVAYVGIGLTEDNALAKRMRTDHNAAVFYFSYKQNSTSISATLELIKKKYKKVIIGVHAFERKPVKNFGISDASIFFINQLQQLPNSMTIVFGNPYAIKNFCDTKNLVACYEDDTITQDVAADFLLGKFLAKGKLPVTVCDQFKFGTGIENTGFFLPKSNQNDYGFNTAKLRNIDAIATAAISKGATPGCVVLVVKDGTIAYHKAFGSMSFSKPGKTSVESIYDIASVTKICATTLAVMKLYEKGKLQLNGKLGDYLLAAKGTNKENLTIENLLLHQAGLIPFIPFYKETIDANGNPNAAIYSNHQNDSFSIRVAGNLFMRKDWKDTMFQRILQSNLTTTGNYIYSDNDFILLGMVVEKLSGKNLNQYVSEEFYKPMCLTTTHFLPQTQQVNINRIAPTEEESNFRKQLIWGDVHDPGAAMFGGVSGHAGLFSDAYDMAIIMQMLLNGGTLNGRRYFQKETIDLFTGYHSKISRRGYGFDKPEKDTATRQEPYPCLSAPLTSFGHTGFTGTCVWADPTNQLIYVFLSNRISPKADNTSLLKLNVRSAIQEVIYTSMDVPAFIY